MATPPVPGAGSLPRRVLDFLRSFGRREQVFRAEPKGQYLSDYSLFAAYGYQDMAEYLRLEADLQSRFIDYEDMDDYVETCLSGDSTVFTLEWGWKEIRWLADRREPFYVLSYDAARKSLVPARADGAALTGSQGHEKPMVRVTLDNGQAIRCTADHLFMTRGGAWVAAGRLVPGQRLMPGDLRLLPLNSDESQTYWQVCQPGQDADLKASRNNRWVWVHRLVGETMLGLKKNEVVHHHEEGGPWNNAPRNLEALDRAAHAKHHLGPIDNSRFFPAWTEERRRWASERMLGNTHHTGVKATKETRQKMSEARRGRRLSPEHRQHIGDAHRIQLDPSKVTEAFRTGGTVVNTAKLLSVSWSTARRAVERAGLVGAGNNHRVLSVEPILGGEPVYDITVPGYRNFVCNGVVVHNSNALDIYADEATQPDPETGKTVWIEADVGDIKDKLKFLFERRLKIDDEVWEIARALCKYGNEYEELLVTGDGVMGLYHLPAPSVRRVEKDKGVLLGFVQSITGSSFSLTPEQFEELLRDPEKRRGYPDATFEDWQVAHFRFRSRLRRAKYGYSSSPNTRVWCNPTVEEIKDIKTGSPVFLHKDGEQIRRGTHGGFVTGRGMVYRFQTRHREIEFTKEHYVLARKNTGSRKHPQYGTEDWFRLEELVPGDQVKICTMMPAAGEIPVLATLAEEFYTVQAGSHGQIKRVTLPDRVTPEFCRFFGFMLGDGWLHGDQVTFARSKYEDRNSRYAGVLAGMGLIPHTAPDRTQTYTGSKVLAGALRKLGWIDGAHEKRVPKWVFGLPEDYRRAFLDGFMDADGWEAKQDKGPHRVFHVELCNRELLRDLKNLVDGLGLRCGNIRERLARTTKRKDGVEIRSSKTYTITFREGDVLPRPFAWDTVVGMEPLGEMDVYDVSIASDDEREHNFIADGVVVHNSVLEPARWIWKRLLLLEDSALIYKLTRAPSRFVFTVDVGTIPRNEIFGVLNKWKDHFKKRKLIDPKSGQLTMRFNPLSYDEDFFLPKAGGEKLAEIDTLQGPNFQAMEDVEYFRSKLFSALKIPKAYMGYEESETKATLSMEDVRWARTIMRVQRELRTGLKRIGNIHLVALGIDPAAVDWDVVMVIPSAIFELAQLEVRNARAEFAEKMEKWVSNYWIMRNVFGFSDEEIEAIQKQRAKESSGEEEPPAKGKRKREGEEPRHVLLPGGRRVEPGNIFGSNRARRDLQPLTEEWLFKGGKRDHEKYLEDNFKKVLRRDQEFSARLFEVRETMMELKHALQGRKGR